MVLTMGVGITSLDALLDNLPRSNWHKGISAGQGSSVQEKQESDTPNEPFALDDAFDVDESSGTSRSNLLKMMVVTEYLHTNCLLNN